MEGLIKLVAKGLREEKHQSAFGGLIFFPFFLSKTQDFLMFFVCLFLLLLLLSMKGPRAFWSP